MEDLFIETFVDEYSEPDEKVVFPLSLDNSREEEKDTEDGMDNKNLSRYSDDFLERESKIETQNPKYGYSFLKANSGGMGAMIYTMMLAYHYAKRNDLSFCLVKEGSTIPRFNGNSDNTDGNDKGWDDYFEPLTWSSESEITEGIWSSTPKGWNPSPPENHTGSYIEWYASLCRQLYRLKPEIKTKIDRRVALTGFNAETDMALHVRRTDKIFNLRSYTENGEEITKDAADKRESGIITLDYYLEKTMEIWESSGASRIYLCTDDKEICEWMKTKFGEHDITVLWDLTESSRAIQHLRMNNKLTREEAWEDNLVALTNMEILIRARYIVGGRMSYFFRIPELIRYPKPSLNIKDSDVFGKAVYSEPGEKIVFPLSLDNSKEDGMKNENLSSYSDDSSKQESKIETSKLKSKFIISSSVPQPIFSLANNKTIPKRNIPIPSPAIKDIYSVPFEEKIQQLDTERIITVSNFLTPETEQLIRELIPHYKPEWWNRSFIPIKTDEGYKWTPKHYPCTDELCVKRYQDVKARFDIGEFAYSYHRSGNHYATCKCFSCTLTKIFNSDECKKSLSNLIGKPIEGFNEMFASKYSQGDFLSMHHDNKKGDYTFVLNLTDDWNPNFGGLTHFWDESKREIYKTAVPKFGSLTIFKLDESVQMDHFVSMVLVPRNRYAFTGWIRVKKSNLEEK